MGKLRIARKKAVVILSSEDEDEVEAPSAKPLSRAKSTRNEVGKENGKQNGTTQSPKRRQPHKKTDPGSPNSQKSQASPQKSKDKTIYSFFNAAVPKQQSQSSASPEKRPIPATPTAEMEEDLIQDDDSFDDEMVKLSQTKFGSNYPLPTRRKRKLENSEDVGADNSSLPRGSQIFKKAAIATTRVPSDSSRTVPAFDQRPWTEKYAPKDTEELAVHKKKVQDVRTWLDSVTAGRDRKRLLVLKGAAGTGKTTTVRLLSQELGLNVNEWKNPGIGNAEDGFVSMSAQFEDFVARTGTFGVLDVVSAGSKVQVDTPTQPDAPKGLILVEEFPNTFSRSSSALQSFRAAVTQYLEASTPSIDTLFSRQAPNSKPVTPIVMIISETLLSTSTASSDSFTAFRLLGPDILAHPGVTLLDFNPVAMTFMTKALELVIRKEARESGRRKAPGTSVLKHLADTGDIRSAVSSLEFLCLRGDQDEEWSGKVNFIKTKRGAADVPLSKMETDSLEMITQRESTLGIFHAVGKVVYNKRELPAATDTPPPPPPAHFPHHARPKVSIVDIETLLNELGTDIQTFVAALHENYILSCQGLDSEDTLDHMNGCIDALSDADLLSPDRFSTNHSRLTFQGTGGDGLRQEEISFQTAVRGMLFNLPHPVKRSHPPPNVNTIRGKSVGQGTAHQMFYPTSLRLWRRKEEVEHLLDSVVSKIQRGQLLASDQKTNSSKPTGIETWRMNRYSGTPSPPDSIKGQSSKDDQEATSSTALLGTGSSAKVEMLLDTLPYMFAMEKRRATHGFQSTLKELEKITRFSGNMKSLDEEDEEPEVEVGAADLWSTDKPVEEKSPRGRRKFGIASKIMDQAGIVKGKMESLVLADDDIEDD